MGFVNDIRDGFKKMFTVKDKKKIIENSIIVIIIGIIFLVAGGSILRNKNNALIDNKKHNNSFEGQQTKLNEDDDDGDGDIISTSKSGGSFNIEKEMEEIFSKINGVGKVSVMITYESGSEKVPAYDKRESISDTQEEDTNGGKRAITQNDVENNMVYEEEQGGVRKPIILKEYEPKVKGVVLVADGAGEPTVKENLVKAVQALLDIAPHKIQVFVRAKN